VHDAMRPTDFAPPDAKRIMAERKVKKPPLVKPDNTLLSMVTAKDLRATA